MLGGFLLFNKVQTHSLDRDFVSSPKGSHLAPAGVIHVLIFRAPVEFNVAIVPQAATERRTDDRGSLDFAIPVSGCKWRSIEQDIVHMSGAFPRL